jgi:hypothetical protein
MKSAKHCRHVKEDGIACHSPALSGESYCHFHLRYKGHRLRTWRARRILAVRDLHLPPPHDFGSILFSLNKVVQAIAAGRLDPDEAGRVLHELSLAGAKLRGDVSLAIEAEDKALTENWEQEVLWR